MKSEERQADQGWSSVKTCPVCGHDGWCRATLDGTIVCCRREDGGCFASRLDLNGAPYYLHRIDPMTGEAIEFVGSPSGTRSERALAMGFDTAYRELISDLGLSPEHRNSLRKRG